MLLGCGTPPGCGALALSGRSSVAATVGVGRARGHEMAVGGLPAAFEDAEADDGCEFRGVGEIAVEPIVARERERADRILRP